MQTKSVEPDSHFGIARFFGMVFLFQALYAFFLALSEQFYDGYFSLYCSILAAISIVIAIGFTIPAAAAVAIPESNSWWLQATIFIFGTLIILLSTFNLSSRIIAAPEFPYINLSLRRKLLGAMIGGLIILSLAALIRMVRHLKGKNGAYILLASIILTALSGFLWTLIEPICHQNEVTDPWPKTCPLSSTYDHNFAMASIVMISNVLAAEGVLRLMAVGSAVEGFTYIPTVIH